MPKPRRMRRQVRYKFVRVTAYAAVGVEFLAEDIGE